MRLALCLGVLVLISCLLGGCGTEDTASAVQVEEATPDVTNSGEASDEGLATSDATPLNNRKPEDSAESEPPEEIADTEIVEDMTESEIPKDSSAPEEISEEVDIPEDSDGPMEDAEDTSASQEDVQDDGTSPDAMVGEVDADSDTSSGPAEPESPDWPYGGPYAPAVAVPEEPVITSTDRSLKWMIWYPTLDVASQDELPYKYVQIMFGEAIRDAAPAPGGPWPLIVFSHGNQGIKEQSFFLTEHLARHGYIVVAPDHQFNTALDFDKDKLAEVALERPRDISAVIDRVLSPEPTDPPWLKDAINPDLIGVSGHSLGAYTSLLVGGTNAFIPQDLIDECENDTGWLCTLIGNMGTDPIDLSDPRVKVSLPMSPAGYEIFTNAGLAKNDVPTLIMTGSGDTITTFDETVEPIYQGLPTPKMLWTIEGGDHYVFSDLCKIPGIDSITDFGSFGDLCSPSNPVPHEEMHPYINDAARTFFNVWLMGMSDEEGILTESGAANAHPTLSFTAELE